VGSLQLADLQTRPTEVLDLTSLTVDEVRRLVPPFETAFQAHMAHWRLDGQPRTARRYTTSTNCPLPTPLVSDPWLILCGRTSRRHRFPRVSASTLNGQRPS
jgi:hypothetical protein